MTTTLPSDVPFGYVVGHFVLAVGDTTADTDHVPDEVACSGTIKFTPMFTQFLSTVEPPTTVVPQVVTATLSADGTLLDQTHTEGVWLVAGQYKVDFMLADGVRVSSFLIQVTADNTASAPLDLTLVAPAQPGPTVQLVVNEQLYLDTVAARDAAVAAAELRGSARVDVATGSEARPDASIVFWVGGDTQPANMTEADIWFATGAAVATPPAIITTALAALTVGATFSQALAASGSTPITWSVTAGTLPDGLSLSSSGTLTGTPTTTGSYTFTVTATNSAGTDTQVYSGTVGSTTVAPTVTTTSLSAMTVGSSFSLTLGATGSTPITWAVTTGTLPAGLSLSSSGVLAGTPTTEGAYSFTVTATNSAGSDTQAYTGNVSANNSGSLLNTTPVNNDRNGTTTQVVSFTPATAGSLLVMVLASGATMSGYTGWTRQAQDLSADEISIYTKTATAGESSVSITLSAANYLIAGVVYEFSSDSTFVGAAHGTALSAAASPELSGLTGINQCFSAVCAALSTGDSGTVTWTAPTVSDFFRDAPFATTDGLLMSVGKSADNSDSSYAPVSTLSVTPTTVGNKQAITWAVK